MVSPAFNLPDGLDAVIGERLDDLTAFRRDLHQHPEPGFQEKRTAARVAERLERLPGLSIETGIAGTGIAAVLGADRPGPCIALRADMDCLPMDDASGKPWASQNPGFAHACGHDGHTACLLGAAEVLSGYADRLPGPVKFIFQPAEEGLAGARSMIEAGVLKDPAVRAIYGLHGWPGLETGHIGFRKGPLMAASDKFSLIVHGQGGHAAMPHLAIDPVVAAAHIVTGLQSIVSRGVDPLDSAVVTAASIHGGSTFNVIPARVEIQGTVRTLRESTRSFVFERIERLARKTAEAHGCTVKAQLNRGYPVCANDDTATDILTWIAQGTLDSPDRIRTPAPVMGGEDFAFFAEVIPAAYWFLGVKAPDDDRPAQLHQPHYDFNDSQIPLAVRLHCAVALNAGRLWSEH
ncbi:MAG: M20 metallopeptidase family protein [Opitutales bacterium]